MAPKQKDRNEKPVKKDKIKKDKIKKDKIKKDKKPPQDKKGLPNVCKPHYIIHNDKAPSGSAITPAASITYTGSQILSAYNIPKNVKTNPVVIAIILAYKYSNTGTKQNIQADLNKFWSNNNKTNAPKINIYNLGTKTDPDPNIGWYQEACLDIQMISIVNPNATIWIIGAASDAILDMINAVAYATGPNVNANIVSMSWGTNDLSVPYSICTNSNVCYLAASGDANSVSWPATDPNCLAIGGTTLTSPSSTARNETTWTSAGCGYSTVFLKPTYQSSVNSNAYRSIPDISLDANPQTGVQIVVNGSTLVFGGTSLGTPIFSGILSIAYQSRSVNSPILTTVIPAPAVKPSTNVQRAMYSIKTPNTYTAPNNCYYDITSGNDGLYKAAGGYDIATGLGSPYAENLIKTLIAI